MKPIIVYHDLSQLITAIDNAAVAILTEASNFAENPQYPSSARLVVHQSMILATGKLLDYATYLEDCERDGTFGQRPIRPW